jgi:small-conductance mechanosensitive channel
MARGRDHRARRDLRRQPLRPGVRRREPRRLSGARAGAGHAALGARARLRSFRRATMVAVAVTALLLMLFAIEENNGAARTLDAPIVAAAPAEPAPLVGPVPEPTVAEATEEAVEALRGLWRTFVANLPRYLIALGVLLIAALTVRVLRAVLRRITASWERSNATVALAGLVVWLLAFGIAVSVLVGDIRALVGSLGLVGLALSWALQTPIESFTGWLMNSFQSYYRVGDRVAVGDVFGDVYRIDFLTTTVWEIGSPGQEHAVQAEQPTGRLITFPNYEVLRGSIVNLTRDFPYVWDELTVPVANRSDLAYAAEVLRALTKGLVGEEMARPAREYEQILRNARLEKFIADEPQVFISLDDSWTNLTVRYLIPARERRKWKSLLALAVSEELKKPEHEKKIVGVFPRRQIQFVGADGRARDAEWMREPSGDDGGQGRRGQNEGAGDT